MLEKAKLCHCVQFRWNRSNRVQDITIFLFSKMAASTWETCKTQQCSVLVWWRRLTSVWRGSGCETWGSSTEQTSCCTCRTDRRTAGPRCECGREFAGWSL